MVFEDYPQRCFISTKIKKSPWHMHITSNSLWAIGKMNDHRYLGRDVGWYGAWMGHVGHRTHRKFRKADSPARQFENFFSKTSASAVAELGKLTFCSWTSAVLLIAVIQFHLHEVQVMALNSYIDFPLSCHKAVIHCQLYLAAKRQPTQPSFNPLTHCHKAEFCATTLHSVNKILFHHQS